MLTQKRLQAVLNYDPRTGLFTRARGKRKGEVVGTRHNERGDLKVSIDNRRYLLHRLAWLWMTGAMPRWDIMHRNGDHGDNRWSNLSEGNRMQHSSTRGHMREPTGIEGVWNVGHRFEATIPTSTALISLGTYATIEEAVTAIQECRRMARERQRKMMRRAA